MSPLPLLYAARFGYIGGESAAGAAERLLCSAPEAARGGARRSARARAQPPGASTTHTTKNFSEPFLFKIKFPTTFVKVYFSLSAIFYELNGYEHFSYISRKESSSFGRKLEAL